MRQAYRSAYPPWTEAQLSPSELATLSAFIHQHCGIVFPLSKKLSLEVRLRKRLRALGLTTFAAYIPRVVGPAAQPDEVVRMIDEVTTNKTDFFREPAHFDYLVAEAVPALIGAPDTDPNRKLVIWSAACASGEEVYTLAMALEGATYQGRPVRYSIVGTDICTEVLRTARRAVYPEKSIEPIPAALRRRHLLQSRRGSGLVRITPRLRARVRFAHLNLLAPFTLRGHADVIFCRNVLIYFDRRTQERVLTRLCLTLGPGGYLFLGHSDSITGLTLPLCHLKPSVYRKQLTP